MTVKCCKNQIHLLILLFSIKPKAVKAFNIQENQPKITNMKKTLLTTLLTLFCVIGLRAQVVTTTPSPLQEDSQDVTIYFHADQGNKGLANLPASTEIYAHTGLITSASTGDSDWKYATTWKDNNPKYKLEYVSSNLWKLNIGDIRTYYGVPTNVTIKKLAFVFRNATGTAEGKGDGNSDILVNVLDSGLQISLESSATSEVLTSSTSMTFTVGTTINANITLTVNNTVIQSAQNAKSLTANYTISSAGEYNVVATATANGETVTQSLKYLYLTTSQSRTYPGGTPIMGPVKNSDGSVTFCVAAPGMNDMLLVGSWNNYEKSAAQQMYYQDYTTVNPVYPNNSQYTSVNRYFWITVPNTMISDPNENYLYYFIVNGQVAGKSTTTYIGDPYARLILDPSFDRWITAEVYEDMPAYPWDYTNGTVPVAVYNENMSNYNWQCTNFQLPDKDNLIIYELLLRDFTGTEGKADGNGTVKLAMERIPYLKAMGVNAIELLPICEFNGNLSWGYNPNFYFAPDKAYGSPDDYKAFIDLCHQNGMAVILDMVFNQSDWLHPWYQMYGGVKNSPMYNSEYAGDNGAPHAYSVLNDWNQDHALVQQQWTDVIKYWLTEYNFDGYRFDLVKGLGTNGSYGNASKGQLDANTNRYNQSRVIEMAYINKIIQATKPGAYCINENLAGPEEENEMGADGEMNWANINNAGCQFAMGYSQDSDMNRLFAEKDSRIWGSTVSYLESHDEDRMAWKQAQYGASGVKGNATNSCLRLASAAAQMIMAPGSHMIWMFGELGNAESIADDRTGNKKLEFTKLYNTPTNRGIYDSYCELITIRMRNPQFFSQNASSNFTMNCGASNWSGGRTLYTTLDNGQELITVINPEVSGSNKTIGVPFKYNSNDNYQILSKSYNSNPTFDASSNRVSLAPNCYVVIGSADLKDAGVDDLYAETDNELNVYGSYGEIVIVEAANGATIYSLDGKTVASVNESCRVPVSSGLYIVKSGKKSVKIIVR